jgi:FlaA1/EpsC-like NDP-sugar epimerase
MILGRKYLMQKIQYEFYSSLNQKIIDALIVGISFYLAYEIRFDWHIPAYHAYQFWLLLPGVMLGRVFVAALLGTYRLIWRYIGLADAITVTQNYSVFSLILLALRFAPLASPAILQVPISVIIIELLLSVEGVLSVRALRRLLHEGFPAKTMNGNRGSRVLLIGAGRAGVMVAKEIASRTDIRPAGFLDDDPKKMGLRINGLKVLGPLSCLQSIVRKYSVQEVIICIPRPPRDTFKRVWALCDELAIPVKIVPTLEEILEGKANIAAFRDVKMGDLLRRDPIDLFLSETEVVDAYRGKRILITGAGGSIGSELAYQLSKLKPERLVLLDKDENGLNDTYLQIEADGEAEPVSPVVADIRFMERTQAIFEAFRPEVIFHAAAHKHVHLMELNPSEAILNNVVGTRNLVELAVTSGASRFVFVSTDKAVKPTSIMGATKRVCEIIVQAQRNHGDSRYCCVRFGNVLGSRGSVIPIFRKQIARGGPVTVTHPDAQRFLMTIPEAVCLLIQAGALASSREIFVLDMGEPVLIQDLARDLLNFV